MFGDEKLFPVVFCHGPEVNVYGIQIFINNNDNFLYNYINIFIIFERLEQ